MEDEKEFNIDELSDDELFEGLNDDIPDEEAEPKGEDDTEEEEKDDAVDAEEEADQPESEDGNDSEAAEDEKTEEQAEERAPDQKFTLKHLDEVREVDRDEVVALAQKGMDYDRIRTERDALKASEAELEEYRTFLKRIAGDQSIEDLIDSTLAKLDVADAEAKGEELDEVEQFKKLRIERVKREAKNPKPAPEAPKTPEDLEKERLSKSIQRFIKAYPDVKATDVPPEVWKDYRDGRADLVECWELHENKKLKDEIKALKQNQKNKERSTGSKKSTGKKAVDPWFDGWPDD